MKFYRLTPQQRRDVLVKQGIELDKIDAATLNQLNQLSENVVGELRLPVGLVQNLLVNGHSYWVPMATEEPSVVAAANHGSNIFSKCGGVIAQSKRQGIYGQIVLQVTTDFRPESLREQFPQLINLANREFASLVKHGGGVKEIEMRQEDELVYLQVLVDPAEAMGANKVNAIVEFLADQLAKMPEVNSKLFAILSNYPSQLTTAQVKLPVNAVGGAEVADKIALLSKIGQHDVYRAVTNNKGIMNGVNAVLMATGNDERAVAAASGVLASQSGQYTSLSKWEVQGDYLSGELTLPLAIGTVGGSIKTRADVQQNYRILGEKITAAELADVIAAVGLANNLAALLAITTDGIQEGHMKLQARNLVANLSATAQEKKQVLHLLTQNREYSEAAASKFLHQVRERED
ncbi:hydroxymethylglutaryl-CoA reductase, degradative [Lactobacillus sp. ESL0703]|uniref:hydroxymethylglutaryl-CoA reductase, degradative n=1 Tax=Lactobacillus sp. ESL0703 TaxID=2983218 RepID=UPI0023F6A792|nr:hydroxymethylglutaryl-CoA reductase, degradative [Lactobacillus sp. ESL0703]MDF7669365.1 hydroxymethylglutaryl-CoA reductase, degradative [Lactobacillus sp. ESL0703]